MLSLLALLPTLLLTAPLAHAAFPGENGKIAFSRGFDDVYTMNPNGSGQADLIGSAGIAEQEPAWSGDGTRLVFVSDEFGSPDIWTSSPSGDARRFEGALGSGDFFAPAWSPDSGKISYSSCEGGFCSGIKTHAVGGGPTDPSTGDQSDQSPAWSPDGTKVAFSSFPGIDVVDADGTGRTTVTTAGVQPSWSPDGLKIAFTSTRDGNAEIYVMNADGSNQTNLTNNSANDGDPDWQPIIHGYARPKAAQRTELRLVPAYESCTTPNSTHGAPLALPSCNPPVASSPHLTVGTPDANGQASASTGFVRLRAICNPPAPGPVPICTDPGDQGDARFEVSFTDVREKPGLGDYTGELEARLMLRITDRYNGLCDGCPQPGTVTDVPLTFAVPCATTPEAAGSDCSVTTTANSVLAGSVREGKRAIWQVESLELYDGGPDGDADTTGNSLFAVQGLFAP